MTRPVTTRGALLVGGLCAILGAPARAQSALDPAPPLATLADDAQLAEAARLTGDPAVETLGPDARRLAQAWLVEGARAAAAREHERALANYLEAYAHVPDPRILLHVGSTLRELGRLADAANTYQRYLARGPVRGTEHAAEVRRLLARLDQELTTLSIRVRPAAQVSLDAGPFVAVGRTLVTRVRPGLHLVRVRRGDELRELTVHGFEGELKDLDLVLGAATGEPEGPSLVDGWLIGGMYTGGDTPHRRGVLTATGGELVAPATPVREVADAALRPARPRIAPAALGVLRIDAEGRGVAGGLGLGLSRGRLGVELLALRSEVNGAYLGARYRVWTGRLWSRRLEPYAAAGMPGFAYDQAGVMGESETKLALGVRVAAGVEYQLVRRLALQADFGFEHFFSVSDTRFVSNVWVPSVGVAGSL